MHVPNLAYLFLFIDIGGWFSRGRLAQQTASFLRDFHADDALGEVCAADACARDLKRSGSNDKSIGVADISVNGEQELDRKSVV